MTALQVARNEIKSWPLSLQFCLAILCVVTGMLWVGLVILVSVR